jgi:hypothetical protein
VTQLLSFYFSCPGPNLSFFFGIKITSRFPIVNDGLNITPNQDTDFTHQRSKYFLSSFHPSNIHWHACLMQGWSQVDIFVGLAYKRPPSTLNIILEPSCAWLNLFSTERLWIVPIRTVTLPREKIYQVFESIIVMRFLNVARR